MPCRTGAGAAPELLHFHLHPSDITVVPATLSYAPFSQALARNTLEKREQLSL
jgi:hypothetical protein